jgi:hypothetical protein
VGGRVLGRPARAVRRRRENRHRHPDGRRAHRLAGRFARASVWGTTREGRVTQLRAPWVRSYGRARRCARAGRLSVMAARDGSILRVHRGGPQPLRRRDVESAGPAATTSAGAGRTWPKDSRHPNAGIWIGSSPSVPRRARRIPDGAAQPILRWPRSASPASCPPGTGSLAVAVLDRTSSGTAARISPRPPCACAPRTVCAAPTSPTASRPPMARSGSPANTGRSPSDPPASSRGGLAATARPTGCRTRRSGWWPRTRMAWSGWEPAGAPVAGALQGRPFSGPSRRRWAAAREHHRHPRRPTRLPVDRSESAVWRISKFELHRCADLGCASVQGHRVRSRRR